MYRFRLPADDSGVYLMGGPVASDKRCVVVSDEDVAFFGKEEAVKADQIDYALVRLECPSSHACLPDVLGSGYNFVVSSRFREILVGRFKASLVRWLRVHVIDDGKSRSADYYWMYSENVFTDQFTHNHDLFFHSCDAGGDWLMTKACRDALKSAGITGFECSPSTCHHDFSN